MTKSSFIITVAITIVTVALWALFNRPDPEPPWPAVIPGFSFSPMRLDDDPLRDELPTAAEIDEDLALLAGKTHAVRTYTVDGVLGEIPRLARAHNINVALGAWLDKDSAGNDAEIKRLIEIAADNTRNVVRIMVGNETVLRKDLTVPEITAYLDRVRKGLDIPVSTAEPWHIWLKYPELADHVDYLAVHMLPYWEGVPIDHAVDFVVDKMERLRQAFPGKSIVIGEVGWPSNGRTRQGAEPSPANEAKFLRRFIDRARTEGYVYYVMEAFDQPWKQSFEKGVGTYWGVYDVERKPKFAFDAPIVEVPEWRLLAAISVVIAIITLVLLFLDSATLQKRGRGFLAVIAFAAATLAVWVVYDYTRQYQTVETLVVGVLLLVGMIGVLVVLLAEAHEWAEALWVTTRKRPFRPIAVADGDLPFVSVHVPAYNEPPEMLIETLNALERLDYPRYEVIVIDNNTRDPAVWEPVKSHCELLGPRFRFFHEDPLGGFKAGALNYALQRTHGDAGIIAVIDSDYLVEPRWLRDLVPQFSQAEIAIVQAPQDYRDDQLNAFKAMCYAEYRGFFYIGMITRNERNAIIQHGTMTMVRRSVLEEVGGWGETTITEDAELGLRVFERGYAATYIPRSYGRGLMPDTFTDFKKQRFRWAFGALQIMRQHAPELLGIRRTALTAGQRYHFLAGWLPWLADGFNLVFNLAALAWSLGMVLSPARFDTPWLVFSALPLALFVFKIAKIFYLYRTTVDATLRQTVAAALAGLALSHTIARAVLSGLVIRQKPFFRTPKRAASLALLQAFNAAREETLLMLALWLAAGVVIAQVGLELRDTLIWIWVLLIQSIPYAAALLVSIISGLPGVPASLVGPMRRLDATLLLAPAGSKNAEGSSGESARPS